MLAANVLRCSILLSGLAAVGCYDDFDDWLKDHRGHHGHHGCKHGKKCPDAGDGDAGDAGPVACGADQLQGSGPGSPCIRKATAVSAGFGYSCAVLAGGGAKCWGGDGNERLGYGSPVENRGDEPGEMGATLPFIDLGVGLSAAEVNAGSDLTCARLTNGGAKCWGYNGYGSTGAPPNTYELPADLPVRSFAPALALSVRPGAGIGNAVVDDGTLRTWGSSALSLGAGRVPVSFDTIPYYDHYHLCAVLNDGQVVCNGRGGSWSTGALGYLGTPATDANPPTVDLGTGRTALAVATGLQFSCALLDDHTVKCWGVNDHGQLGQGDTSARGTAAGSMGDALLPIPLGADAIAITAGWTHACAVLQGGSVKCWGENTSGQLGLGTMDDRGDAPGEIVALPAVDLGPGRTAVAIDAGRHTCALLDHGGIKCWGPNTQGELGLGDTTARGTAPAQMGAGLPEVDLGS